MKEKMQKQKHLIGADAFLNFNCWLVRNLNYAPYKRCQYCELKFHKCLFLQYQLISLLLIFFSFALLLIMDKTISTAVIIVVFVLVIVYGYFFNSSTEKIIKANFYEKKSRQALKELSDKLEERVASQTKDIKEKNQHLEELLNMKSDFLRTVNHQLNTPLSMMNYAFLMMEEKSLPVKKGMEIAAYGLERMKNTILEFWDAFELEGQRSKINLAETDIEKIAEEMVKEKNHLKIVKDRNLKIRLNKPAFLIPRVMCDSKKIAHVISNLLDNGAYYTEKGSVSLGFEKIRKNKKDFLKISVSDTGCGITEEDRKKLFTKFSRGAKATSLRPDGSGLGLYIAKKIIEDSGGELKLEKSEISKGTTFSFVLPIAKPKAKENLKKEIAPTAEIEADSAQLKNITVLMVEDEKNIVDLHNIYFSKRGIKFFSTYDLAEAKALLRSGKIDVLILDIIIKKKEEAGMINVVAEQGYELLKDIKNDEDIKNIPVIMFTNLNTEQDKEKAKKLGASAYIFKGNSRPQDLLDAIKRVV